MTKVRENIFDNIYKNIHNKDFPNIIDIELTNHCILNCKMCSRRIMTREKGYISSDTFYNIIEQCKENDVGIRFIRWGEPFQHPRILTFCDIVKETGLPLHITTNGLLLKKQHLHHLVDIGVDSIIFSMQGSTPEEYEYMRENKKYYNLVNNIHKLIELRDNKEKPYITITNTMTERDSKKDIAEFRILWENVIDEVNIGITNMSRLTGEKPEGIQYIKCKEPYYKLGIDWDGKVTACCGDYDNLLTIGHIDDGIENLWKGNKLKYIRKILDNGDNRMLSLCKECYPAYGNLSNNTSKKGE